jgi:hypothetical protein
MDSMEAAEEEFMKSSQLWSAGGYEEAIRQSTSSSTHEKQKAFLVKI